MHEFIQIQFKLICVFGGYSKERNRLLLLYLPASLYSLCKICKLFEEDYHDTPLQKS